MIDFMEFLKNRVSMKPKTQFKLSQFFKKNQKCVRLRDRRNGIRVRKREQTIINN